MATPDVPPRDPAILLVGNYEPDGQRSMQAYAGMLLEGLSERGWRVRLIKPPVRFNLGHSGPSGPQRWLGYLDKFALFPPRLSARLRGAGEPTVVHVCDHSNAPYLRGLLQRPHLITCHDLTAVRAADPRYGMPRPRWIGRVQREWVRRALASARHCVCVSHKTLSDFRETITGFEGSLYHIPNALHHPFVPLDADTARARLSAGGLPPLCALAAGGFLMHVGTDCWSKNRLGLLKAYAELVRQWPGAPELLLLGPPPNAEERQWIATEAIAPRVVAIRQVETAQLEALYALAGALVLPSRLEGFGWPTLEAMACACPVAASQREPMTEVCGDAAAYFDPEDHRSIAAALSALLQESGRARHHRIQVGLDRVAAFSRETMLARYEAVYRTIGTTARG